MSKNNQDKAMEKCDQLIARLEELKKAITTVGSTMAPSSRKPVSGLGAGWSMDPSSGSLHHSTQGVISTSKHPDGYYQIKHGGRSVGRAASPAEAGAKIKNYVHALRPTDTGMHNGDPMAMKSDKEEEVELDPRKAKAKAAKDRLKKGVAELPLAKRAAAEEAEKLKKNFVTKSWVTHSGVPNGDEEVIKAKSVNPAIPGENALANQLANMMAGKAMLGQPPRQPTDEEMFGRFVPTEEQVQKAEAKWNNTMNWLEEASKPIASRFASTEEEEAYWANIKVADRDDGKSGY